MDLPLRAPYELGGLMLAEIDAAHRYLGRIEPGGAKPRILRPAVERDWAGEGLNRRNGETGWCRQDRRERGHMSLHPGTDTVGGLIRVVGAPAGPQDGAANRREDHRQTPLRVELYPRMKPSSSSDAQAIARSMLSPCCVQRAIILV